MKSNSGSSRLPGTGKSLDTPAKALEEALSGMDRTPQTEASGERGTKKFDYDGDYGGNVVGCCSKPVSGK
jgi:hypothetical protein